MPIIEHVLYVFGLLLFVFPFEYHLLPCLVRGKSGGKDGGGERYSGWILRAYFVGGKS